MKLKNKLTNFFSDKDHRISLLLYVLLPVILNLILESFEHKSVFGGIVKLVKDPYVFLCSALIIALTLSVSLLSRRRIFWVSVLSFMWLCFGIANFVLLCNRVTPFTSCDLYLISDLPGVIQKYFNVFQMILIGILLVLAIAGLVTLFFKAPRRQKKVNYLKALLGIAFIGLLNYAAISSGIRFGALESKFGELSQAYLKNGFVYCFTNSIVDTGVAKPKDYSLDTMVQVVAKDRKKDAKEKPIATPNIIIVQLESFFDITSANNVTFSSSPLPNFQRLCEENGSGKFSVPIVGAGTVNAEFEVITGMNLDDFGAGEYPFKTILKNTACESTAFNLKNHNYTCHVVHNNTGRFYSRNIVYANLGFDDFTSVEYMNDYSTTPTGWAKDTVLTKYIMDCLQATDDQDLVYTISVQPHGAYEVEGPYTKHVTVTSCENEEMKNQFEYYANQLYEVDIFLQELVDALSEFPEDTILAVYGDHLPSLDFTDELLDDRTIYQTDYFIWNNMGLEFEDQDIEANELSSIILGKLNIKDGVINAYHQNYRGEEGFNEGLATLEYDILYGKGLVYGGEKPYETTDMKMSLTTVTVDRVTPDMNNENTYVVSGNNFTKYSKVYVNDEKMNTTFIDSNTLKFVCEELNFADVITVWQSKLTCTEPYSYNIITMENQNPDAEKEEESSGSTSEDE